MAALRRARIKSSEGKEKNMSTMKYTKEHHWLRLDDDGVVTVGITEHAQNQLGDVVYVQLPQVGQGLTKGQEAVVLESVKAASGIMLPVEGEVTEINPAVTDDPGLINEDPLGRAWLFKLRPADASPLDQLMDEAAYKTYAE
jgi:glycine cleavage system H protein